MVNEINILFMFPNKYVSNFGPQKLCDSFYLDTGSVVTGLTSISRSGFSEQQATGEVQVSMEVCNGTLRLTVIRAKQLRWRTAERAVG